MVGPLCVSRLYTFFLKHSLKIIWSNPPCCWIYAAQSATNCTYTVRRHLDLVSVLFIRPRWLFSMFSKNSRNCRNWSFSTLYLWGWLFCFKKLKQALFHLRTLHIHVFAFDKTCRFEARCEEDSPSYVTVYSRCIRKTHRIDCIRYWGRGQRCGGVKMIYKKRLGARGTIGN